MSDQDWATEKAREIACKYFTGPELVNDIAQALRAARNEALEEAAKVANIFPGLAPIRGTGIFQIYVEASDGIERRIRALKENK